jgi:cysteine-rich repeat protein
MYAPRAGRALAFVALGSFLVGGLARAAEQSVLGKTFVVKDPKPGVDPSKRTVVVLGKELLSSNTISGDPVGSGATVEIVANGTSPSSQVFTLPAGASSGGLPGWKALGNPIIGYTYKDALGVNGPVKSAVIKNPGGTMLVKVSIKGANGPGPQPHITVVPPAPGTDGHMDFTIVGGDTYHVGFGGAAGGKITNAPTKGTPNKVFKIVGTDEFPTTEVCSGQGACCVEGGCAAPVTSAQCTDVGGTYLGDDTVCPAAICPRCGNNSVEVGETCDDGNTTNGDGCSDTCQTSCTLGSCTCEELFAVQHCDPSGFLPSSCGCGAGSTGPSLGATTDCGPTGCCLPTGTTFAGQCGGAAMARGACCLADSTICFGLTNEAFCSSVGGTFQGGDTSCGFQTCGPEPTCG